MPSSPERLLNSLQLISRTFDEHSVQKKIDLLNELAKVAFQKAKPIIQYHSLLLFALAYPENEAIYQLAMNELQRLSQNVEKLLPKKNFNYELSGTGIHATELNVALSIDMVRWLVQNYDQSVLGFSSECSRGLATEVFHALLKNAEFLQVKEEDKTVDEWCEILFSRKGKEALKPLLDLFDNSGFDDEVKDLLYNQLKLYISLKLTDPISSTTFNRSGPGGKFYHKKLLKHIDINSILKEPLPKEKSLSERQKEQLVSSSRWILANLSRETDPSTYADINATKYFELARGYAVCLYSMKPLRRLPFESYVGYLAFKNGLPIAYGGGWLFFHRCKFGINLLETYRGGEASFLFAQLMRVYHQHFDANHFIIEPYQFGKNNTEGLKSGAIWFYYRLGFRFFQKEADKKAAVEFQKISERKNYKTPLPILKSLAIGDLHFKIGHPAEESDPNELSRIMTQFINTHFNGDRSKAYQSSSNEWLRFFNLKQNKQDEIFNSAWQQWSMLLSASSARFQNKEEQKLFFEMLKEKACGDEKKFIFSLQKRKDLNLQFLNKIRMLN